MEQGRLNGICVQSAFGSPCSSCSRGCAGALGERLRVLHLVDLCAGDLFGLLPSGAEGLKTDLWLLECVCVEVCSLNYCILTFGMPLLDFDLFASLSHHLEQKSINSILGLAFLQDHSVVPVGLTVNFFLLGGSSSTTPSSATPTPFCPSLQKLLLLNLPSAAPGLTAQVICSWPGHWGF